MTGIGDGFVTQHRALRYLVFLACLASLAWTSPLLAQTSAPPPAGLTLNLDGRSTPTGEVFRAGFLTDSAPGHQRLILRPFRDHMEAVLQRPVELVAHRDARTLLQALRRGNLEYAIAPGSLFAAAHRACGCVTPLASQPNRDGSQGLYGVVVTDKRGPLRDLSELNGARLAIVGEDSVVAHRITLAELWRADVTLSDERLSFAADLPQAHAMLARGEIDALITWTRQSDGSVIFDASPLNALAAEALADLAIIWRTRPVPGLTHLAHTDLPEATSEALRAMLVGLTGTNGDAFEAVDTGSGRGFVARELEDYAPYLDAYSYWDQSVSGELQ